MYKFDNCLPVADGCFSSTTLHALLSGFFLIGGAGGGDVGDGFIDKLLLDPIIMRRMRSARTD